MAAGLHEGGERPCGLRVDLQAAVEDGDVLAGVRGGIREVQHRSAHGAAGQQGHARRGQGLYDVRDGEVRLSVGAPSEFLSLGAIDGHATKHVRVLCMRRAAIETIEAPQEEDGEE